jgi:anaerobic selenocysteine-containing dehydrogenase
MSELTRRNFLKIGAATVSSGLAMDAHQGPKEAAGKEPESYVDQEIDSCCQFCQVRCTVKLQIKGGRVVNIIGNPGNFWTAGAMCPKGKSVVELNDSPQRLLYPLKRTPQGWQRISYTAALQMVADKINQSRMDHPDDFAHRVVLFMPLWDSRESELAALMAMQMAGFPDACSPGDTCIASAATVLRICLGSPNSPTTLDEALNTENFVLWGANIAEMYPPYMRWLAMAKERGARLIFIDPRKTPTSTFCDMHVRPRPGTDGALALCVVRRLIQEGSFDAAYVEQHVDGFKELIRGAEPYTPEYTARITDLGLEEIHRFSTLLGQGRRTLVWLGGSLSRYTNSMQTVQNIIALQAITNNLVGTGRGIMNVQGGKPGGTHEFLEQYRAQDMPSGLNTRKVLYNMKKGRVDVLLLNGSYRRYPDAGDVKKRIEKVGFVLYRGFFMDEEAQLADLIMPGTMPLEHEGSQYGAQRQVVWRRKAIDPPGETSEDWRFYTHLGRKINGDRFPDFKSPEEIYERFRNTIPSWYNLTLPRIKTSPTGVTWPFPKSYTRERRGSIFGDGSFLNANGKIRLYYKPLGPIRWFEPKGSPRHKKTKDAELFPLIFIQGKVVQHWQQTYTNWSRYMGELSHGNFIQIHPDTAKPLEVQTGDPVYIETVIGSIQAIAVVSTAVLPGVVFTPSHPGPANKIQGNMGQSINTIIPGYWSKVSAQFNGFGCRIKKSDYL